jgi:hypothetical protein
MSIGVFNYYFAINQNCTAHIAHYMSNSVLLRSTAGTFMRRGKIYAII